MSRLNFHWGELEDWSEEGIAALLDSLSPAPVWLTIREWHPTKMRIQAPDTIGIDYSIRGNFQGPPLPEYINDWKNFCAKIARAGKGKVKVIQIGNEPNLERAVVDDSIIHQWLGTPEEWAQNILSVLTFIKNEDPDVMIFPGGCGGIATSDEWYMEGINYLIASGADIDGLDMHYYGDLPEDMVKWNNYLADVNKWCSQRSLRYSFTEVGFPNIKFYVDWDVYDSLRTIECLSMGEVREIYFSELRKVKPNNLMLPENQNVLADSVAVSFYKFCEVAFNNECYFVEFFGLCSYDPHWYHNNTKCLAPEDLYNDRKIWYRTTNIVPGKVIYSQDENWNVKVFPIADTIKSISKKLLTKKGVM
ncbi:MAG: hypothetical protein GF317_04680 [Candidatus Lokiarchaeota archaeon]|nr:hypothetical protein [Candidatus Lokiarchaeota archaeon]